VDRVIRTKQKGDRFIAMEAAELRDLSYVLDTCKTKFETATKQADKSLSDSAARVLNRSLLSTLEACASEAQAEAEDLWKRTVVDIHAARFAGKYPFVAAADDETPMKSFSEFFNPKSGTFWKTIERLTRLRDGFKYEDRSLVRFSTEYDDCVKRAELFRAALYGKEAEQIEVPFELQFGLRTAVTEVVLSIGDKRVSSKTELGGVGSLIWSEAAPRGAKLEIRHDDNQWKANEEYAGKDWGLLRLLTAGGLASKGDKLYGCTWTYEVIVSGQKVARLADCDFRVAKKETPLAPAFFTEFKVPDKMGPR
jgi:type VI protein secretion system component VasK